MYFPVAQIEVSPWLPPLVAFVISFCTSMGGVSGAFLLLPFQMSVLGFTSPAVSATNQLFNIVAIPSGVCRYVREGRMVWPLAAVVVAGTLPGVFLGAWIRIRCLPDPRHFKLFAGLVLLYIGGRLFRELLGKAGQGKKAAEEEFQQLVRSFRSRNRQRQPAGPGNARDAARELPRVRVERWGMRRIVYDFYGRRFDVSSLGIMALSLVVGVVGGAYGIGGGAIIAPFFVSVFGLPVYTVAGAALLGTFVTSVAGVGFYQAIAPFYPNTVVAPDWLLGGLFGLGGAAGMYCGARSQKFVPARLIKGMLALVILSTASRYFFEYFFK